MRKLAFILLFLPVFCWAQTNNPVYGNPEDKEVDMDNPTFVPMVKVSKVLHEGDSIPYLEFNDVYVYPKPVFKNARQQAKYNRLVYNVKKVLPIAKEANQIIIETYEYLQTLPDKKAKEEHMKRVEKDIKLRYTPRMKKLSYSQGKLLIKLINRECNASSYNLIQAFLGPIRAGFYQAFAWTFGASLMKTYDPEGVDPKTKTKKSNKLSLSSSFSLLFFAEKHLNDSLAYSLKRVLVDMIHIVDGRMPSGTERTLVTIGIIWYDVDTRDFGHFVHGNMVVGDAPVGFIGEHTAVAHHLGGCPYLFHNIKSILLGDAFLIETGTLSTHHIEKNTITIGCCRILFSILLCPILCS